MKTKRWVLLKTLLRSTSSVQILKTSKDPKKRKRARGTLVAMPILYLMVMFYCIMTGAGLGMIGLEKQIPVLCAITVGTMAFVMTLFKTNGYLFNFKEYDMLMALPFAPREVAAMKFLYMYIVSLPWNLCISIAMMLSCWFFHGITVLSFPIWLVLSPVLPVLPTLAASFFGYLAARISARFPKANLVRTILGFVLVIFSFSLRFIIEAIMRNHRGGEVMGKLIELIDDTSRWYLPARWFSDAVLSYRILDMLLLVVVSLVVFEIVFALVGKHYRRINSSLQAHGAKKDYTLSKQKTRSVRNAIAFKEFKRFLGSSTYLLNVGMGNVLAVLLGVASLIFGVDRIIRIVMQGAPIDAGMLSIAFPMIIYFVLCMVATTVCSPSLEGKNYWILQSLPVSKKTIYQGKMLFNLYLTVPCMCFGVLCLCISGHVPVLRMLLYLLEGIVLCGFSTTWGCVCGIKHMRMDWENEVEVIKQGSAVMVYLLPNMFGGMLVVVALVAGGLWMNPDLLTVLFTVCMAGLTGLCYRRAIRLAETRG